MKSSRGQIINNPYDSVMTVLADHEHSYLVNIMNRYSCGGGLWRYTGNKQSGSVSGLYACRKTDGAGYVDYYAPPPSINVDAMKDLAVTQAYANADASDAAVLCTLAEFGESVAGILAILKRLRKIYRAIRRLDLYALAKQMSGKEYTARYMEARYSIRPLIYDTKQIIAALDGAEGLAGRQTFRGYQESSDENEVYTDGKTTGVGHTTLKGKCERLVQVRAGVLADVRWTHLGVWGLDQPLEMLWEIVPFSFVIDWFLNVGQTIASWTPNVGIEELASWVVVKDTSTYTTQVDTSFVDPELEYNFKEKFECVGAYHTKSVISTTREVNPQRSFVPRFNVKLSAPKLLDLGIILRSFFK
jgi:hypothetical protein